MINTKRQRMPLTINAAKITRDVAIADHDNNSARSPGGSSFHPNKKFPRSVSDGSQQQVRKKVTTKQLPSTCLRLDNWKLAGGVKKVKEFLRKNRLSTDERAEVAICRAEYFMVLRISHKRSSS